MRKEVVQKLKLGELRLELVSMMKLFHLKQPREIYQIGSFQEDHKVPQRYPENQAYIEDLDAKHC